MINIFYQKLQKQLTINQITDNIFSSKSLTIYYHLKYSEYKEYFKKQN